MTCSRCDCPRCGATTYVTGVWCNHCNWHLRRPDDDITDPAPPFNPDPELVEGPDAKAIRHRFPPLRDLRDTSGGER